MPRRNRRDEVFMHNVHDQLGTEYSFARDPEEARRRAETRRRNAELARQRTMQTSRVCQIRTCTNTAMLAANHAGPAVCYEHAVAVWQSVQRIRHLPVVIETAERLAEEDDRRMAAEEARLKARDLELRATEGQIYIIRVNGLIKVGWSSELYRRLKSYGPDIEILCHYPATRADETNLHRQLTPYRHKGREWYRDCRLIRDLAEKAVAQHGPPRAAPEWTSPKAQATRPHGWTG